MRFVYLLVLLSIAAVSCHDGAHDDEGETPVLTPKKSMRKMQLQDKNLVVKLVASEPLVNTPVAMNIDDAGRIWVVEMADYKPIKDDSTQQYPTGRIAILEDTNEDGKMDKRKVFLDSVISPRALCLYGDGILISEPPNLWYYHIENDKPTDRELIDSAYTVSENIEGQTNGLLRSIDNWVYSVGFGSSKRYRRINGVWKTEKTFLRGQWGITQDNYGHLFYNNNSQNFLGDYFLPGVTNGNKYLKKTAGFNQKIVPDNRTYPLIPTPGVNRGYREGELDSTGRLVNMTAACGPLVYRGNLLPEQYSGNSFVAEPAAYLIKRNIIEHDGSVIQGKQAWEGEEFLSSTDERFRPVNLYDGPDGALYIVDMYRGVIQDDLSLTDYLKEYSLKKGLQEPINTGRIYKIIPKKKKAKNMLIPDDQEQLVALLADDNGWVRDKAQQKIIDKQYIQTIDDLKNMAVTHTSDVVRIHALWTLEGLHALDNEMIQKIYRSGSPIVQKQTLTAMISVTNENNYGAYLSFVTSSLKTTDSLIAPYWAFAVGKIYCYDAAKAKLLWGELLHTHADDIYVVDAVLSSVQGAEEKFKDMYQFSALFQERLHIALKAKDHPEDKRKMAELKKKYEAGYAIYTGFCQTCHGSDGNGIDYLAPPLNGSEWVVGDKNKLISILLYGLTGPIKVKDKVYKKPTITGDMPGIKDKYSEEEITGLINYIRNAWNNESDAVDESNLADVKKRFKDRNRSFTIEELEQEFLK